MASTELDYAKQAVLELGRYGVATLSYETAQFEPYTSQQRPDLLFSPNFGRQKGRTIAVELRMPSHLPRSSVLEEHRDLVYGNEASFQFALATTRTVEEDFRSELHSKNIQLFEAIQSGDDLALRLLSWASPGRGNEDGEVQPGLFKFIALDDRHFALAARSDSLKSSSLSYAKEVEPLGDVSFDELFWSIFGDGFENDAVMHLFNQLKTYISDEKLEGYEYLTGFLKFLKETLREYGSNSNLSIESKNLHRWFREFNSGRVIGSKL